MSAPVPSGWTETTLGRVLQRSPSYGINAPALPRGVGKYPYLRITDIDEAGRVDIGSLPSVRDTASETYILSEGDIVVARTGASVGKSHLFKDAGEPVVFAGFLIRLSADENAILPSYLAQLMQTAHYWDWIRENSARSGQPGVNGQQLKTIPIVLPPLPEQQAIAAALSDADGVVAGLERVIAKKRLIKQGAMQDLLTARRRLPGFSGEWAKVQLKDYTSHGSGNSGLIKGTLQRSGRVGDYPAFTASGPDLMLDFFEQEGDAIIISAVGSRCGKSFRAKGKWSAIANTHVLRCREGLDVDFAFIFMNDEDFWLKGGTGQPFVLVRRTLERPLLLPPVNEQQAIASVLRDMDAEIQTLESRLAKARTVKEGMMQNLLTGRVRLV